MVRDKLWPEDSFDSSETIVYKNLFFVLALRNHVSEPYRRTDFTFELKICILVLVAIRLDDQTLCRIAKAPRAFLILEITSSSVPPLVVIVLPRYMNFGTSLRFWPSTLIGVSCRWLILIVSVLSVFICSPTCLEVSAILSVLACIWEKVLERAAISIFSL